MDEHVTRDLFRAISGGWRNPGDLAAIALAHLFELCPHCRREFQAWRRELGEGVPAAGPHDYDAVLDRFRARAAPKPANSNEALGALDARAAAEEREARSGAEELLRLSPAEQAERVRREPERFAGLLLAEMLIEDSRKKAPDRPKEAATHARLARLVLHHTPLSAYACELYVRALAYLANAIRVIGDLPRADQILGDARYFFRALGCGDRILRAELDKLEGTLRVGQQRPEEAVSLFLRALMAYRLEGQFENGAAVLISLSRAHYRRRALSAAMEVLDEASRVLEVAPDAWLSSLVQDNLAVILEMSGRLPEAVEAIQRASEQFRGPVMALRVAWRQASIAEGLGDLDRSAKLWQHVIAGFSDHGLFYDRALASLNLARLYADQGDRHEVERLMADSIPVFRRLELPTKVVEAESLVRRAASA